MQTDQFALKKAAIKAYQTYVNCDYKKAIELALPLIDSNLETDIVYKLKAMMSYCYLSLGHYQKGWELWSYRPSAVALSTILERKMWIPYWMGENADYTDKNLLIIAEEGIGDELYNSAVFHLLKGKFKEIYIEADIRLIPLYERTYDWLHFFPRADTKEFDSRARKCNLCTFIGDLPRLLNADFKQDLDVPIKVDSIKQHKIHEDLIKKYGKNTRFVGISYHTTGERADTRSNFNGFWKRVLTQLPDSIFVDLQCNEQNEQKLSFCDGKEFPNFVQYDGIDLYNDIESLAALIVNMDKVVSIANSAAHLSCRLMEETIILLPKFHNCRWDYGTGRSIWYPSGHLVF